MIAQRLFVYVVGILMMWRSVRSFSPLSSFVRSNVHHHPSGSSATIRRMVGPGVVVAPAEEIRQAVQNPDATVVDARTIEELIANGYFTGCESNRKADQPSCRWVHAPSTPTESPLLQLASASLIPNLNAPVVVHCGSGIRAGAVKKILESLGYTKVMNAGGLTDLQAVVAETD